MRSGRCVAVLAAGLSAFGALLVAPPVGAAPKPTTTKAAATKPTAIERLAGKWTPSLPAATMLDGTEIKSAAATKFGILAAGITDGRVSLWTSSDGRAWARIPEATLGVPADALAAGDRFGPSKSAQLLVAADEKGAVVVVDQDVLATSDGKHFDSLPAAQDGIPLRTEPVQDRVLTFGNSPPAAIAVAGPKAVLVGTGSWFEHFGGGSPNFVPVAWASDDRLHWSGAPLAPANGAPGTVNAVTAVAGGGFVMAGTNSATPGSPSRGDDAGLWTSTDGRAWTAVDPALVGGPGTQEIVGLAAQGRRVVAVGFDGPSFPYTVAVWISADGGTSWKRAAADSDAFPAGSRVSNVTATTQGFVASGSRPVNGVARGAYWTSADGEKWKPVYAETVYEESPEILVAAGNGLVAIRSLGTVPASTSVTIAGKPSTSR